MAKGCTCYQRQHQKRGRNEKKGLCLVPFLSHLPGFLLLEYYQQPENREPWRMQSIGSAFWGTEQGREGGE